MTLPESKNITVSFPLEGNDGAVERMHSVWDGESCILDNSPFYVYGISCGDKFSVVRRGDEFYFREVISRGGHSTYRIKLPVGKGHDYFLENWERLEKIGCTYEGSSVGPSRLYSIDVPPGVDVFEVYRFLEDGENKGIWSFEEGYYYKVE